MSLNRFTTTGSYELFLDESKKLISFEVTAEDKLVIHRTERCFGRNLLLETLDFKLGEIITSHGADGKSIYFGKFGAFGAQGLGVKLEEDGRFSAGYFSRGKLNGVCKVTLPENDLFVGNMHEDFPEGEGLFFDAQRKSWLYGYFKNFECITLLKDEIFNALPYKRRIFSNQFESSRTCDRCAIEIPLVDFARDFMRRLESHLAVLEVQNCDDHQNLSAPLSRGGSSKGENQPTHIKIKELMTKNSRQATYEFVTLESKDKDSLKSSIGSKKYKTSKKAHSAENSERVTVFNSECSIRRTANPEEC
jgi:hypothetical protein